jgi:hypothetical protein
MKNKKKNKDDDNIHKSLFDTSNNKLNIFAVKTSLKSILKDYDKNFIFINTLVKDANECVIQTYQFIRLYFLYCFYNNIEFIEINTDNVLYFMRALGTRDNRGKKPENIDLQNKLNDFYNNEFYPLIEKPKFNFLHKTQFNAYIAEHIATSFNNNIKEHFISRFRRFLNIFEPNIPFITDKKDDELIKERKRIYNLVKNSILNDDIEQSCPEEFKKFAFNIRNEYLPSDYDKSFYYDCKKECNISYYLKQTIKMNLNVEKHNNEINEKILNTKDEKKKKEYVTMKKKLFQVIPLRTSNIPSYVSFDKAIINTFFNDKSSKYDKNINEIDIWNRIINMNHKIFKKQYKKNYRLSSLSTDGIGVSLTFKKIGLTKNKCNNDHIKNNDFYLEDLIDKDLELLKNKKIVCLDPGKKGVCLLDENRKNLNYNTIQRRKESLRTRNNKIMYVEKLNNYIIEKETKLSNYNDKTVNYEKFKDYIKNKTIIDDEIRDFYYRELFRKLKFRTNICLRKSEDKFLNNIEKMYGKKDEIVIGYGDWSRDKQMKHLMPSSNIGLRKKIEKKYKVFLVNEYCTSKLCSSCNKELKNYIMSSEDIKKYDKKHKKKLEKNDIKKHRLLVCLGCSSLENKKSTFWNRDINACVNMLNLTKEWINKRTRNPLFCRKKITTNTNSNLN